MKHKHDVLTYRRFLIAWVGSHLFCTVVYFVFHSLCFVGGTFGAGLRFDAATWSERLTWDMYATLAPTFAVMPTLVILSLLQALVSKRTIDVLPRYWIRANCTAYLVGFAIVFVWLYRAVEQNTIAGEFSDLNTLFAPLYAMFALMAVVQGLCLLGYGLVNAGLWTLGALLALGILIPFNNDVYIGMGSFIFNFYPLLTIYPILLSVVTALLCWRIWRENDVRKRHSD
jgi:hypothetical protein